VVWYRYDGHDHDIFLYNGTRVIQLTDNAYEDVSPQINNNGHVVWEGYDGHDFEIFLYNGTNVMQLTDNDYDGLEPQINNNGDVVWSGYDGDDWQVFLATRSFVVRIRAPNGGEVLQTGLPTPVEWDALPQGQAVRFKALHSCDKGMTWQTIGADITTTSTIWNVPLLMKNKTDCFVKIIGYDASNKKVGSDESDGPFAIEVMKVTSPNGGELLISGGTTDITWQTNQTKRPVTKVKLFYTLNGGTEWKLINNLSENLGIYSNWVVPNVAKGKGKCKVKVVLKDASGNVMASDTSDGYLTISPASPPP
jgi:hypothetical protein